MTKTRPAYLVFAVAALLSGLLAGTASAAPGGNAQSEHERVVDFWTHARVAQAVPRHIVFEPGPGFVPAAKPPDTPGNGGGKGGGGGDDGDSSLVTGESWITGGLVSQATGKVLFALDGSYYVCSASVVVDPDGTSDTDSLILTAGHCAHDQTTEGFATNWVFIPAYDEAPAPLTTNQSFCADTKYGCWSASALTVHHGFVSAGGFNDEAVVHDFAVATVREGGLDGNDDLETTVGAQGIQFSVDIVDSTTYAFGYPAAQKYKGNDLVYCAGPVGTDPNTDGSTYRIECDMTGGSSGGPWLTGFTESQGTGTLSSLNSYGYRGDSGMYGPKFNTDTEAVYNAANGAIENTVVGVGGG